MYNYLLLCLTFLLSVSLLGNEKGIEKDKKELKKVATEKAADLKNGKKVETKDNPAKGEEIVVTEDEEDRDYYELNVIQKKGKVYESHKTINILTEDEIDQLSTGYIPDLYKHIAGVYTQQTAASQSSPFLRGLTGQHTLIIFDGVRINNTIFRYGPNQYSAIFDPFILGKVEVLKGGEPTLYGSDAVGGVISLSSKNLDRSKAGQTFTYNSASNSFSIHGDGGVVYGPVKAAVYLSTNDTSNLTAGDGVGEQDFTSFHHYAAAGKVVYDEQKLGKFTLFGSYFSQRDGYRTDKSKVNNYRIYPEQEHILAYLKYQNYFNSFKTSLDATFSYQHTYEHQERWKNQELTKDLKDYVDQFGASLRFNTYKIDNLVLYYGLDFNRDMVDSNSQYMDDAIYDVMGQYLKAEYKFNDFLFGVGERYTFVWLHENDGISYEKHNVAFSAFAQYFVNKMFNVALNFDQGFRAPNLNDLTGSLEYNGGYEFGDDNLSAENAYSFELAAKFNYKGLYVNLSGFYMILTDFIGRVPIEKPAGYEEYDNVVKKTNTNEGFITGGELSVSYQFKKMFKVDADVAYTYGEMDEEVDSKTAETEQNPMRRIPPLSGSLRITKYFGDNFSLFYRMLFAMEQDRLSNGDIKDSRIPEGGTPGYFINSLGVNVKFDKFFTQIVLDNILNEKYKYHGSGVYSAGRSIFAKISFDF